MTWNPPSNVSTGDNLTSTLWNNLLGTSGSLKYVYDQISPVNLQVAKATNTVIPANGSSVLVFSSSTGNNFPFTNGTSSIVFPVTGVYAFSFIYQTSVSTNFRIRFTGVSGFLPLMDTATYTATSNTLSGLAIVTAGATVTCTAYVTTASTLYGVSAAESSVATIALLR